MVPGEKFVNNSDNDYNEKEIIIVIVMITITNDVMRLILLSILLLSASIKSSNISTRSSVIF